MTSETLIVDIEEFRQNLDDYLRRAKEGEYILVMEDEKPVAEVREGRPEYLPKPPVRLEDLPEPLPMNPDDPNGLSRTLEEVRGSRPFST
jgi:antitoxin (DNA-binding transcriptional repressor) of toxin-antitoxin stability system